MAVAPTSWKLFSILATTAAIFSSLFTIEDLAESYCLAQSRYSLSETYFSTRSKVRRPSQANYCKCFKVDFFSSSYCEPISGISTESAPLQSTLICPSGVLTITVILFRSEVNSMTFKSQNLVPVMLCILRFLNDPLCCCKLLLDRS